MTKPRGFRQQRFFLDSTSLGRCSNKDFPAADTVIDVTTQLGSATAIFSIIEKDGARYTVYKPTDIYAPTPSQVFELYRCGALALSKGN